ncbi:MAG TPA: hypothetical protein VGK74_28895 [Symbiobacteriaceae bacterium]
MSKKGERNQELQPGKAEKAYGGYLPSVQTEIEADEGERPADANTIQRAEQTVRNPEHGAT